MQLNHKKRSELRITLPLSKSMAARALIIGARAGLSPESSEPLPDCSDTRELAEAINQLLLLLKSNYSTSSKPFPFDLGLGGTSLRFFLALVASIPGLNTVITCHPSLQRRPILPLVEALQCLGADISFMEKEGYPPLKVHGKKLTGGKVRLPGNISSQFASALLMVAPDMARNLEIEFTGTGHVSKPYIRMTERMMERAAENITPEKLQTEPCWSSASYFYAYALLDPDCQVIFSSLTPPERSMQGDSAVASIFARLGVDTEYRPDGSAILRCNRGKRNSLLNNEKPLIFNMEDTPDLIPALCTALSLCGIKFRFENAGHLRFKESDRIEALRLEMEKLGYTLETEPNVISWTGKRLPTGEDISINPHGDHRIAMAFAITIAKLPYIFIEEPGVTEKSFPGFFNFIA